MTTKEKIQVMQEALFGCRVMRRRRGTDDPWSVPSSWECAWAWDEYDYATEDHTNYYWKQGECLECGREIKILFATVFENRAVIHYHEETGLSSMEDWECLIETDEGTIENEDGHELGAKDIKELFTLLKEQGDDA